VQRHEAEHGPHQGRLTGAIGAEDGNEFTLADGQVDVAENVPAPERNADVVQGDGDL
jgi:hypothetical protein